MLTRFRLPHMTACFVFIGIAGHCHAHNINPLEHKGPIMNMLFNSTFLLDKLGQPVHETFTSIAYRCHTKIEDCAGSDYEYKETDVNDGIGKLIQGVIWNDDPSLKLLGSLARKKEWGLFMYDADKISACQRNPQAKCKSIDETYDLLYRSHYGDLQFLHSMAAEDGTDPAITKRKIMEWAKFAYKVSTGEIGKDRTLAELESSGESMVNAYFKRGSWKVGFLFTRQENPLASHVKNVALGSLLHMVQDSYSDAHVNRVQSCVPINPTRMDVVEFHNYAAQKGEEHKVADARPVWLNKGSLASSNPVWHSARLIQLSFKGAAWPEVEKILDSEVYKLSDSPPGPARKASGGDPDCWKV